MRGVKWVALGLLVVLLALGALAWWQRSTLETWWAVRGLKRADAEDQAVWVERVGRLGEAVIDPLVDCLDSGDDRACRNALAALDHFARAGRASTVAGQLARPFAKLAPDTQAEVLSLLADWCKLGSPSQELVTAAAKMLAEAAAEADPEAQAASVELAAVLAGRPGDEVASAVREAARAALRCSTAEVRLRAVRLCLQPGVDLLEQVVGLLREPSAEVRRAAVLAVGPAEQAVREDVLLVGLHDTDAEVRRLTESALRGRGLRPEHLELGRLLTHPEPATRLEVLDRIRDMLDGTRSDLDPGAWLRRLSHDPSAAVRAAAVRLMSQQELIDLGDRLDQMARSDPSPTVSQLAAYYRRKK